MSKHYHGENELQDLEPTPNDLVRLTGGFTVDPEDLDIQAEVRSTSEPAGGRVTGTNFQIWRTG